MIVQETTPSGVTLAARLVYWIFGLAEAILGLRVVLSLLGANTSNPFAHFIYTISTPLAQPFFTLFGYEPTYGSSHLELGTLAAIVVYALIAAGIVGLLSIGRSGEDV